MLTIMEMSLYRPEQMTADGLHHSFSPAGLPTVHTADLFVARIVAEVREWAEALRKGPAPVALKDVLRLCPRCGLVQVVLLDFAQLYVQWVIVDGEFDSHEDPGWMILARHECLVDLLPAHCRGRRRS